mmetsp:Transcript_17348/g.52303  ORF Transcript_17348/g.52303 Transcript_17348/m.52303 type:complete len:392 (+) Transcript_17348:72-1247(+)
MSVASEAQTKAGCCVHLESSTWARERGDLFDFEVDPSADSSRITRQDFVVQNSAVCVRSGANVQLLHGDQVNSSVAGSEHLMSLVRKHDMLWVHQGADAAPGHFKPSLIVKDLPQGSHALRGGETIRLGCARIRIRQVVAVGPATVRPNVKQDSDAPPCHANPEAPEVMEGRICRICMLEGPNEDDPLIAPCSCKGSVQYVHLACLREWLRVCRKLPVASEACDGFEYHPLKCDICKGSYSSTVHYSGGDSSKESEPLAEMPFVRPPFVVLEVPGRHYGGGGRRSHVLSLARDGDKVLKLGRAHNCHLRIPDASISRWHASIRLHEGKILLEDHGSKFGTLVEMQRPMAIDPTRTMSLQVGCTVLRLTPAEGGAPNSTAEADHRRDGVQEV